MYHRLPSRKPVGSTGVPDHVVKHVVHGTAALGIGITIERGMGFAANVLAARLGGSANIWGLLPGDHHGE